MGLGDFALRAILVAPAPPGTVRADPRTSAQDPDWRRPSSRHPTAVGREALRLAFTVGTIPEDSGVVPTNTRAPTPSARPSGLSEGRWWMGRFRAVGPFTVHAAPAFLLPVEPAPKDLTMTSTGAPLFFEGWGGLVRVLVVGVLAYAGLVFMLRISGNRTLSKLNAFDLIVTVALGSTLASILTSSSVVLAEGLLALALLIGLQFAVTWLSVRSSTVAEFVKAEPTLILYRGEFLHHRMRRARITEGEVRATVREQGIGSLDEVEAVVLETDGSLSVVKPAGARPSALAGLVAAAPDAR